MSLDLAHALRYAECHEDVIRLGEHEPCERPAVAVRLDPECTHESDDELASWPCSTVRAIASALGVEP